MQIGGWNPDVISRATNEEAAGLERLGTTMGDVGEEFQVKQNALQHAQAVGQATTQTTQALAAAQNTTDPNQVKTLLDGLPDIQKNAAETIQNPYVRDQFNATIAPHIAETTLRLAGRQRDLTNDNMLGNVVQSINSTINTAATLADDTASVKSLDAVKAQIGPLVASGAIKPEQAFKMSQDAAAQWVTARYNYKLAQAQTTRDPADYAALMHMAGLDPRSAGIGAETGAPAPTQTAADGSPLPPARPAEFGGAAQPAPPAAAGASAPGPAPGSPQAQPGISAADSAVMTANQLAGKNYHWDGGTQPDNPQYPGMPKGWTPAAPAAAAPAVPGAPAGPASYPALGGGAAADHQQVGNSMGWERGGPPPGGYGKIDHPYNAPLDQKGPSGLSAASAYQILKAHGASDNEALMLSAAAANESGYDAKAVHDGGKGYGLFGHNLQRLNLIGIGPEQQLVEALNEARKMPEVQSVLQNAKSPEDLATAMMRYERPQGYTPAHPEDGHNYEGRLHTLEYFAKNFTNGTFTGSNGAPLVGRSIAGPGQTTIPGPQPLMSQSYANAPSVMAGLGLPPQPTGDLLSSLPDGSTGIPPGAPKPSTWPSGTVSIGVNPDGTQDFVKDDGTRTPVPGSQATGNPWMPLPPPAPGSVASMLAPDKRAELQLRALEAVQRMQREDAVKSQRDNHNDINTIKGAIDDMKGGAPILNNDQGWDTMRQAYGKSADPQVRQFFATADATRRVLSGFVNANPQAVNAAAQNIRAEYNRLDSQDPTHQNPALDTLKEISDSADAYAKRYDQEAKIDPLGRAEREGVIPNLKPLDPSSPTLQQDLATRVDQAQRAAQFMKLPDVSFIRPDEKATFRQLAKQGGNGFVNMAKAIVAGAGPNAGQFFKEIGGDAGEWYTIGSLANDPNADHTDVIKQLAEYRQALNDPQAAKNLPRFNTQVVSRYVADDPLGSAYAGFGPERSALARSAAHELMGAQANENGKDPANKDNFDADFFDKAFSKATGATYDKDQHQWGGIASVEGSRWSGITTQKVLIPTDMRADKFETVIGGLTPADIAAMPSKPSVDGTVIDPTAIRRGTFVAVPSVADGQFHGLYNVILPDKSGNPAPVLNEQGKPWVLDMNKLTDVTRGDAFMPRVGPAPQRSYKSVPPTIPPGEPVPAESTIPAEGQP